MVFVKGDIFEIDDFKKLVYTVFDPNSTMEDIDLNLDDFLSRVNSDLVGKFINIASRTSGFIHKYFEGKLFLDDSKTDQEHISVSQKCKDIENEIKTCFCYHFETRLVEIEHYQIMNHK